MTSNRSSISVSRRAILGAASIPVVVGVSAEGAEPVVERCGQWLAADAEIDRLVLRWGALDDQLVDGGGADAALQLERVEARLDRLHGGQAQGLEEIAGMEARDLRAVVAKLAVVASATREGGGPIHDMVLEALGMLTAKRG